MKHKGPTKAAINHSNKKGWIELVTPYSKEFVEELKLSIQPSHRLWNPTNKVWEVSDIFIEDVVELLKKHFDEVVTDMVQEAPVNLFSELFKILPKEYHDRCYFSLAQALHPDKGGSEQVMTQLNLAYQEAK